MTALPEWFTEPSPYGGGRRELRLRGFVALVTAGISAFLLIVTGLSLCGSAWSCAQLGQQTGHPTDFRIVSGCYIDLPGLGWVPRDQWQNVNIGRQP